MTQTSADLGPNKQYASRVVAAMCRDIGTDGSRFDESTADKVWDRIGESIDVDPDPPSNADIGVWATIDADGYSGMANVKSLGVLNFVVGEFHGHECVDEDDGGGFTIRFTGFRCANGDPDVRFDNGLLVSDEGTKYQFALTVQ